MSYLDEHRNEIFKKYSNEELKKDCENFINGKGRLQKFLNHFFEELIFESSTIRGQYFSPMDALKDDNYINWIIEYTKSKPKFYTSNEVANIKSFFRNGGRKGGKVANFPPRVARDIYLKYFNRERERESCLNCLDTSSGFGSRMSAVLLSGNNYFSTDPNPKLHDKLFECAKWMYDNGFIKENQKCELVRQGSEIFIPEWEGIMDVSFTSPPYFNLEKYCDDESASTKNYDNYDLWLEYFAKPTIDNTYRYLKVGGYAMINIKNMTNGKKLNLFDDWGKLFTEHGGYEFVEIFDMEQTSKKVVGKYANYSDKLDENYNQAKEPIMCFRKVK